MLSSFALFAHCGAFPCFAPSPTARTHHRRFLPSARLPLRPQACAQSMARLFREPAAAGKWLLYARGVSTRSFSLATRCRG